MLDLPNIEFKKPIKNPTIDSDTSLYTLPFYKDSNYFANLDNFINFIKATETLVRTSKYYSRYIKYLKEDVGLNFCQVLSNIKQEDETSPVTIEMHHGPILTLFDYVSIVVDHMLYNDEKINTYKVADIILEEHFKNNIQVVMVSKTVHEEIHLNNIFINTKQAFGDLNAFIEKYKDGISDEQLNKINKYIELSEQNDSYDKGILDLRDKIKCWNSL